MVRARLAHKIFLKLLKAKREVPGAAERQKTLAARQVRAAVRNTCLYYPDNFRILGLQTLQNSQIFQPERFSDVTGLCHHSAFGAKSAENGQLRKVRFFMSDVESGARASKFARFPPKTGSRRLPCSKFRFLPRKACEFQPAELCHRFVAFWVQKAQSRAPSPQGFSRSDSPPRTRLNVRQPAEVVRQPAELVTTEESPLHPAPFLVQKAPNGRVRRVLFCVGLRVGCPSLQIRRFSVESGLQTTTAQFSAFGPEKRRIPARRACHRLSPLRRRSLWGRKVRKTSSAVSMGLQILVDPASSHMLVSKPFLKRSRARFLPGPPLIILMVIHQWFMNGQGCFMNGQGWLRSRHVAEVSQAFFDRHFRSIHRIMPSGRFYRSLRHFAYW